MSEISYDYVELNTSDHISKMGPKLINPVILFTPIDVKTRTICRLYTKIKCLYNFLSAIFMTQVEQTKQSDRKKQ